MRCGFRLLLEDRFERLTEPISGPVEPSSSGHLLTSEHAGEFGRAKALPLDQQEDLLIVFVESAQRLVHCDLLRRDRSVIEGTKGPLSGKTIGQGVAPPLCPPHVGGDPTRGGVQPRSSALAGRNGVDPSPGDEKGLGSCVLGVGPRPGSPTAVRGDVESVGVEKRIEPMATFRFSAHTTPGARLVLQ